MSRHLPTSHSFYSQRLRLQFVEWGDPQAPTIVFVHGVRDHSRTWMMCWNTLLTIIILSPRICAAGDSEWVQGSGYDYGLFI